MKTNYGQRTEIKPWATRPVGEARCITCYYLTRLDCPLQDQVDQYEMPVKPFVIRCPHYKVYQDKKPFLWL